MLVFIKDLWVHHRRTLKDVTNCTHTRRRKMLAGLENIHLWNSSNLMISIKFEKHLEISVFFSKKLPFFLQKNEDCHFNIVIQKSPTLQRKWRGQLKGPPIESWTVTIRTYWKIHRTMVVFTDFRVPFCSQLGGGCKYFLFSPLPGGNDPIWRAYFANGLKPPTSQVYSRLHLLHLTDLHFSSKTSKTTKTPRVGILPVRRWEGKSTHELTEVWKCCIKNKHGWVSEITKKEKLYSTCFVWCEVHIKPNGIRLRSRISHYKINVM